MTTPLNPWKRTLGLAALILVGLLASPAARAEIINFETSLAPWTPTTYTNSLGAVTYPAAYQPIPYLKITIPTGVYVSLYDNYVPWQTPYTFDHTTGSYGGTHNAAYATYGFSGPGTYPMVFTFDQTVAIPSFYLCSYNAGYTRIVAYNNTAGTAPWLYSNVVATAATWGGWQNITALASLNTNIMRLEIACTNANAAIVDDMTVYPSTNVAAFGPLQGIQFPLYSLTLQPGDARVIGVLANYASVTNSVTPWATFSSSDPNVATVPQQSGTGFSYVTAVNPGTADIIATFGGFSITNTVTVSPLAPAGALVPFDNTANGWLGGVTFTNMPATYLSTYISYTNVGLYNGGPDHTLSILGYYAWAACQTNADKTLPQVYKFTQAFSVPSLWLTTLAGLDAGSNIVTIKAYSDTAGTVQLGSTVTVTTPTHGGAGFCQWVKCTDLDSSSYNGQVRRLEISAPGNAMVDDMVLAFNYGALTNVTLALPAVTLKPGMSRQLAVTNNYSAGNNVNAAANALYSSSDPTVATVTTYGRVKAVGPGTATITAAMITNGAAAQGVTNTLPVTVALPANATLVTFNDGGWPQHMYNFAPINASGYEPVPGLFINWPVATATYPGIQLYDSVGGGAVDHTTGQAATTLANGNNYCALGTNASIVFNRPVGIPSLYVGATWGTNAPVKATNVIIQAWSDAAGTTSIYSNSVAVPTNSIPIAAANSYSFADFTDLASYGNTIMKLSIKSAPSAGFNWAVFDDMTIVAAPLGALQAVHLQMLQSNVLVNATANASAFGDYAGQANVDVSAGCGTVFTSSDPNIFTVSGGTVTSPAVVVKGVSAGTATLTATLGAFSDSVTVTVGQKPAVTTALANQLVECGGNATFTVAVSGSPAPTYQWSVNGSAVASATSSSFTTNNVHSAGSVYTIACGVTNVFGGVSTNATLTVQDTIAPVPDLGSLPTATGQCSASVTAPTAQDACDGLITGTTSDPLSYTTQGTFTVHWTYTDSHAHSSTQNQTVIVQDTLPPGITVLGANPLNTQYHATFTDPGVTTSDNCAGVISVTTNSTVDLNALGTYSITYIATDAAGNSATNARTVVVGQATVPPGLDSSENPGGFKDSLTFTATLPADATGSVTFLTNDVSFAVSPLSAGAASCMNSDLPRGTNLITVIYSGDANYTGSTNSLSQVVTNHPPVAAPMTVMRTAGADLKILISDILANVTDADGDVITNLTSVLPSTNGVILPTVDNRLCYSNTNNVLDQFGYVVDDGFGGSITGYVNIVVSTNMVTGQVTGLINPGGNPVTVQFAGIPDYSYVVQRSTNLVDWVTLTTTNAPSGGVFSVTDSFSDLDNQAPAAAYYRLGWTP